MIFMYAALLFALIWYISDKSLKERFIPYLKWGSLIFIGVLACTDAYFFIETARFYDARAIDNTNGVSYSWYNNVTNTTVTHSMYAKQDIDSGTILAYHAMEMWVMEDIVGLMPYLAIFCAATLAIQFVIILYSNAINGKGGNII